MTRRLAALAVSLLALAAPARAQLAPNVGMYKEDAAHTDGQWGVLGLHVRKDVAAALCGADGDYCPLIVDSTGRLWITGTVTANAGTNLNTSALALEATLGRAQGSTTSGQTGPLVQGAVTTGAPTYTTGQTAPLSLDTTGALRVAGGAGGTQYAEDTTHASGDTLTMAGVVQQAADAALSTDGDRSLLQVDANGYLKVNIKAGAGSGGTAAADNSTFTGGATNVTPMGALYDTTPPAVTDGNIGAPRMTATRDLQVTLRDGAGQSAMDDANDALRVNVVAGGGAGGTSSTFGSAFPGTGTASGFPDGTNMQGARVFDGDSGGGTQYVLGTTLRKIASGGTVEAGTSADPLRVDPTGTTTQPVSAASLPLPTGAATDRTTAAAPSSVRLSDGAAFYDATKTGQLPAALVGGRLDENVGSWLGSTAPTVGQKAMTSSLPVALASDQSAIPATVTGTVAVSGSVTVTDGAGALNVIVDSGTVAATQSGTWNVTNVSGTVSLPTGASTLAEQQTQTTALQLIDNLPVAQGSTTSGQSGALTQGAVTTGPPTYTTAQTSPLSLDVDGGLRTSNNWPYGQVVKAVGSADTFRIKAWNSWPQLEQIVSTNAACSVAGPENLQAKVVIKFRRKSNPQVEVKVSRILTLDNDRGAQGVISGGVLTGTFGAAANRQRSVADAAWTTKTATISSCTVANPTVCLTGAHTLATGDLVVVSGSAGGLAPSLDGLWYVTIPDTTHIQFPVAVTQTGTANVTASRVLTSATASFTQADVGKNITLSTGGTICPDETWGTGQPWASVAAGVVACQGPKFPAGTIYNGIITVVTNSTTVTVKPSMTVNPAGSATLKIDPILMADEDGLELGPGWITGLDVNYWQMGSSTCTMKRGQLFVEGELQTGTASTTNGGHTKHEGITLFKQYVEPSGHIGWPYGNIADGKVSGRGYTRLIATTCTAGTCIAGAQFTDTSGGTLGSAEDWSLTVPAKAHWRIVSMRAQFTASGTAATRTPGLIIDDGGSNVIAVPTASAFPTASQTHVFHWAPGLTPNAQTYPSGAIIQTSALPADLHVMAGWRIKSSTTTLTAGDQWSALILEVEEWIEE